jgi:iron complex outermembrane receptor protein
LIKNHQNYVGINGSLGHQFRFNEQNSLSTSVSYTERAPNFQELYSDGFHMATGTYEIGNSNLVKEKATAFEVSFKNNTGKNQFVVNVYTQFFKDYIALNPTGNVQVDHGENFDEYANEQVDAVFYGLDLENKNQIAEFSGGVLHLVNKFDFVRAKDKDSGQNIARISPPRFSAGLEFTKDKWAADVEAQYVFEQTKTALNETRSDAYTLTNLGYSYTLTGQTSALSLFARVRNIFDVEARNHVSFLKDIAPLPGRNFILGAQTQL